MGIWLRGKCMKFKLLALSALAAMAGCATPPQNIKAVQTGEACTPAKMQRLNDLSSVQSATASNDAVGVFLIGLPMGSMGGGNHHDEIARLKGSCEIGNSPLRTKTGTAKAPPSGPVRAAQ